MDEDTTDLEREVIARATRGLISAEQIVSLPDRAFTGAPRLFAWTCVLTARRAECTSFFAVRYTLATAPRLDLPLDVWAELMRETEWEIDAAEAITTLRPNAVALLLATTNDEGTTT